MKKISVLLVDDHEMVRYGLKQWMENEGDITVSAEGASAGDVLRLLPVYNPDVLVLDLHLPDRHGYEVIREIRAQGSPLPILAMTGKRQEKPNAAFTAGANGFLAKTEGRATFVDAVRWVTARKSPKIWVSASEAAKQLGIEELVAKTGLTKTDLKILALLDNTNTDIAGKLFLCEGTVKNHVTSIYSKLGVASRIGAHKWAVANGLS